MPDCTNPRIVDAQIFRRRTLRLPGEVLVEAGQRVEPDTPVARARLLSGSPYVIDIGPDLRSSPETRIEVDVADRVAEGDRVARGPVDPFEVHSPIDGVVEYLSRSRGRIYLREEPGTERAEVSIDIVDALKVWPFVAWMHVRVREGDEIEEGQILAAAPAADGANYAYSPFGGVVDRFERSTGSIVIRRHVEEKTVFAYVAGVVEEVIDDVGAVVRADVATVGGVYGRGPEAIGPLAVVGSAGDLASVTAGSIVVLTGPPAADTAIRCAEVGAVGLVAGGLDWRDLCDLAERAPSIPVVLTSGFGRVAMMPGEMVRVFHGVQGETAAMSGEFPGGGEVVLPRNLEDPTLQRRVSRRRPTPGDAVRLLDPRLPGSAAHVLEGTGLHQHPTGMYLDSVEVRLDSLAETRWLPVANMEVWEDGDGDKRG